MPWVKIRIRVPDELFTRTRMIGAASCCIERTVDELLSHNDSLLRLRYFIGRDAFTGRMDYLG